MTVDGVSVPSVSVGSGEPLAADARAQAAAPQSVSFTWRGSPWSLTRLCLMNAALSLITVGLYSFWGRTEIRRRLWSNVRLLGEPLVYHGTGRELLTGFMAVLLVLLVPLFVAGTAVVVYFGQASTTFFLYQAALFAMVYPILTAVAHYRARRYRLSRTSWRGIRGSMDGSSGEYGLLSWGTALTYPFTLGWIAPFRAIVLNRMLVTDTQLGSEALRFDGSSRSLYGRFALLWFGSIALYVASFNQIGMIVGTQYAAGDPFWWQRLARNDWLAIAGTIAATIFIWSMISSFYYAKLYNHVARSTSMGRAGSLGLDAVRFRLDVRGRRLIWLFVTNSLITYLSLYVLRPVATARSLQYFTENLAIVGPFDPARLGQNLKAIDTSGEGLAQAFDLDAF